MLEVGPSAVAAMMLGTTPVAAAYLGTELVFQAGGPDYAALVEAALSGKAGLYLDPSDPAVMWQDSGKSMPVAAPADPVRVFTSKWGAAQYDFTAPNDASRPAWDTSSLVYDGSDDRMFLLSTDFGRNCPALALTAFVKPSSLAAKRTVAQISGNAGNVQRLLMSINTNGSVEVMSRRLDSDSHTTVTTAAGLISAGTAYVITAVIDFAGTGGISIRINGVEVQTGTLAGSAGNTSNTAVNRVQLGANNTSVLMNGEEGRMVATAFLPTPTEIGHFEALVAEVAI